MANKQLLQLLSATKASTAAAVIPGPLALVMAGISICSKEWLYRITKTVGEKIRSQVVIANAWHHRSDAYSSVLALCSIAWARTGFPAADAAAGPAACPFAAAAAAAAAPQAARANAGSAASAAAAAAAAALVAAAGVP